MQWQIPVQILLRIIVYISIIYGIAVRRTNIGGLLLSVLLLRVMLIFIPILICGRLLSMCTMRYLNIIIMIMIWESSMDSTFVFYY